MCTTIDTVISLIVVYIIGFLCIALIGYRIGWWIGEIASYLQKLVMSAETKNELVGKIDKKVEQLRKREND